MKVGDDFANPGNCSKVEQKELIYSGSRGIISMCLKLSV